VINPTATILSACMMLDYLGFEVSAKQIKEALVAVYAAGVSLTQDQGGTASTTDFCDALVKKL